MQLQTIREWYENFLWRTMDLFGVTESIERKVLTAVGIQFIITIAIFLTPFIFAGTIWYLLATVLFTFAIIALVNTIIITRRDFCSPIQTLDTHATKIANGNINQTIEPSDQTDEVGSLINAFVEMQQYLDIIAAQAEALAEQKFADPSLEEQVPGEFGDSLSRMAANLESYTDDLETMTAELETVVDLFNEATSRAREGDLTATIDEFDLMMGNDQYQQLLHNYNDLIENLHTTICDVQEFAIMVSNASDEVSVGMNEIDTASSDVAISVQEISDGAFKQAEELQTVYTEMNTLSATVEEIAASADDAAETANLTAERSREGKEAVGEAITELAHLESRMTEAATAVEGLVGQIGEIDQIVSVIDDIAEETNLLALNAGIEAARAGQAGDGFAVVADEVKRLAEETRASAGEISERITEIQELSTETVEDVTGMETQVSESVDTIKTTLKDFEKIIDGVDLLNQAMQEISNATDEQARSSQTVVEMVDEVSAISQETTSETEHVAAAAQEQAASLSQVNGNVETLARQATELQSLLNTFVVERDVLNTQSDEQSPSPLMN